MKTFLIGETNARNIAALGPACERHVFVRKTGELIHGATFPDHICTTPIEASDVAHAIELYLGRSLPGLGEAEGWRRQRESDQRRNAGHLDAFHDQIAAEHKARTVEAHALTIGQLKQRLTAKQFAAILHAARRNVRYDNIGSNSYVAGALGDKLRQAFNVKAQRRKLGYGWKPEMVSDWHYSLTDAQKKSPLARFHVQLQRLREERRRKKAAALAKRREPMNQLILHIARHWHRHGNRFGLRGDGISIGTGCSNSGTKRRGGPGTRCEAGVRYEKGRIYFHPTHGGKSFSIPAPPMALRKRARVGVAHPSGLFCAASEHHPGVDENWDWSEKEKLWCLAALSVRGVRITEAIARGDYAAGDCLAESNAEVRRIMLERLPGGYEAIVASGALVELHRDDFGVLYREPGAWGAQRIALVKVVNSTPEPDGTYKDYFLRVPPDLQTAKAAVAWTFGLKEDEYQPAAQS